MRAGASVARVLGREVHRRALDVEAAARPRRESTAQLGLFEDAPADPASSDALPTHEAEATREPSEEAGSSWGDVGDGERLENARSSNEGERPPHVRPVEGDPAAVWVESESHPSSWYLVTNGRCSCKGFVYTGNCRHAAFGREASKP